MHRRDVFDEPLATVPISQNLSKKQLRLISELATELDEPAGTMLIQEGNPGHEFIIVIERRNRSSSGARMIGECGPGG